MIVLLPQKGERVFEFPGWRKAHYITPHCCRVVLAEGMEAGNGLKFTVKASMIQVDTGQDRLVHGWIRMGGGFLGFCVSCEGVIIGIM